MVCFCISYVLAYDPPHAYDVRSGGGRLFAQGVDLAQVFLRLAFGAVGQSLGEAVVFGPQGRDRHGAVLPLVALVRERRLHLGHLGAEHIPLGAQLAAGGAFGLQLLHTLVAALSCTSRSCSTCA